jgi:hypothetical protein
MPSAEIPRSANQDQGRSSSVEEDMRKFVPQCFWDYKDVFTCKVFNSLPAHSSFDHQINLEESFVPQRGKVYAISPREQKGLDEFLEESLSSG